MIRIIGVGDNVVDQYLHERIMYPGGNAFNVAVFAQMLGCKSAYMGIFGNDAAGEHVYKTAKTLGLDLTGSQILDGENGCARVIMRNGDRVFCGSNRGGISRTSALKIEGPRLEHIRKFHLMHTSCYSYIDDFIPILKEKEVRISYDFSDCYDLKTLETLCPYLFASILSKGDRSEEEALHMAKVAVESGNQLVIMTMGEAGIKLWHHGLLYTQRAHKVIPVDTMAAGDSFISAFLVGYLRGFCFAELYPVLNITEHREEWEHYMDCVIKSSLYQAAEFSAYNCLKKGSFGYGIPF